MTIAKARLHAHAIPPTGCIEGLGLLAAELGTDLPGLLAATERIVHGTTVATNALLERKGARVGLLTTEGHRDVIEMREGLKDDRYNLRMPPPVPLVPRALRLGVRERMALRRRRAHRRSTARSLAAALDDAGAGRGGGGRRVLPARLPQRRATSASPGARSRARLPGVYVSLSSEVLPQIKEYERVWTTVVNAYVGPALARYLAQPGRAAAARTAIAATC